VRGGEAPTRLVTAAVRDGEGVGQPATGCATVAEVTDEAAQLPPGRSAGPVLGPRRLVRTFRPAIVGLVALIRYEPNAQIHLALAAIATALGVWLGLPAPEWALLATLFGLVIGLEALNTAVEGLADLVEPRPDPRVGRIKDLAAGGVLAAALAAAAAGGFVFVPRLLRLLG
jgi:diacylglycerol kinase (ATP)